MLLHDKYLDASKSRSIARPRELGLSIAVTGQPQVVVLVEGARLARDSRWHEDVVLADADEGRRVS